MDFSGALKGIKVLDLSRMLPGPYCSMILADHGAEVVAIEDGRFKDEGLFFNDLNRNKKHMSLNLKSPKGLAIFKTLARDADVIIEGFRPGVVKRLGVDYDTIKRDNPKIIYCSISGYGQTGPACKRVGHDVNYISMSGVLGLIGEMGEPPSIPGVQFADIAGGAMNAAIGIMLALFSRGKTGAGQFIDISMADGMVGFLSLPYYFTKLSGKEQEKSKTLLSHRFGCYNTYETKDKRYISIGAVEKKFWKNLCEHLGCPDLIDLQYDEEKRHEVIEVLRQTFIQKNVDTWEMELSALEVCYSKVQSLQDVLEDPLFYDREMVVEQLDKKGKSQKVFGIPIKLSSTPGSIRKAPDEFGESTREILEEMAYSDEDIESFYRDGVV